MGTGKECRSDAELLFAFRKGNVAALDELVARYQGHLHGYLQAMTGSPADADDLFQETWLRVVRNPGSFRGGNFPAWLWRITRNLLIDRLRRRKPVVSLDDTTAEGTPYEERTPAHGPTAAEETVAAELGAQIAAAKRKAHRNRILPFVRFSAARRRKCQLRALRDPFELPSCPTHLRLHYFLRCSSRRRRRQRNLRRPLPK